MQTTMQTTSTMFSSVSAANVISALAKAQQNVPDDAKASDFQGVTYILMNALVDTGLSYIQRSHSSPNQMGVETVVLHTSGEFLSSGVISLHVKDDVEQNAFVSVFNSLRGLSLATAFGINYQISLADTDAPRIAKTEVANSSVVTITNVPAVESAVVTGQAQVGTEAQAPVETPNVAEPVKVAEAEVPAQSAAQEVSAAVAIVDINGKVLTAEEIAVDAAELETKTNFLATLTDITRLENAKVRANDFFKAKMNIEAFKLAIEERIKELKQPVPTAG